MIYRDYIQHSSTQLDTFQISAEMTQMVAQKIVERNSNFSIEETVAINSTVTRTTIANANIKMQIENTYRSGNTIFGNGMTIKLLDNADNVMITKYIVSGSSYSSRELGIHISCYKVDNENCIYHFSNYDDASDGFDFAIQQIKNDSGDIENNSCICIDTIAYNMSANAYSKIGDFLVNTHTHTTQGYLRINNAELINANAQIIGKHARYIYEVVSDGGLVSNCLYTIDEETYMYANNLLWKV